MAPIPSIPADFSDVELSMWRKRIYGTLRADDKPISMIHSFFPPLSGERKKYARYIVLMSNILLFEARV